jgi:hypothetical protein
VRRIKYPLIESAANCKSYRLYESFMKCTSYCLYKSNANCKTCCLFQHVAKCISIRQLRCRFPKCSNYEIRKNFRFYIVQSNDNDQRCIKLWLPQLDQHVDRCSSTDNSKVLSSKHGNTVLWDVMPCSVVDVYSGVAKCFYVRFEQ